MSPLPIVLVGCGAVSQQFYAPALRTLEASGLLRVSALVDPSPGALSGLHAAFPNARPTATLAEADAPPDSLAIVASPPQHHAVQTIAACARGWHVLCEKPMAASTAEADLMIAAAHDAGRTLAVGPYKRFFTSSQLLKFLCVPGGPLGALRSFSFAEGGPFTWPAASAAFFQRRSTPGGVLLDLGVHALDLLLWWLGEPDTFDYADDAMGGLEANAKLTLSFGGITGRIQLSRDWATAQRYDFAFERGTINWTVNDANGLDLAFHDAPAKLHSVLRDAAGRAAATNAQSFIAQLQHVANAARHGAPVLIDGREGRRALRLIEACYAHRTPLPQPWLSATELAHPLLAGTSS